MNGVPWLTHGRVALQCLWQQWCKISASFCFVFVVVATGGQLTFVRLPATRLITRAGSRQRNRGLAGFFGLRGFSQTWFLPEPLYKLSRKSLEHRSQCYDYCPQKLRTENEHCMLSSETGTVRGLRIPVQGFTCAETLMRCEGHSLVSGTPNASLITEAIATRCTGAFRNSSELSSASQNLALLCKLLLVLVWHRNFVL